MANRYPLVLDTTDGNKIKELPENDNLFLRTNSITGVQNITALGTIDAVDIKINGQRLQPKSLLDLTDTPENYEGQANQVLKVNTSEDGLDFVSLADIGDITADNITLQGNIVPDTTNTSALGTDQKRFSDIYATNLIGNLFDNEGAKVFDATTGEISYASIVGAPDSLSEFSNDIGYVTQSEVNASLEAGITISNFVGSVFADDSTLLVDGVASRINPAAIYGELGGEISGPVFRTPELINETDLLITTDGPLLTQSIDIVTGGSTSSINLISQNIQLLGDIQNRLQLEAGADVKSGITGDVTGSIFYDDSTIILDAVLGRIIAPTISGNATFENDITVQGNLIVQGTTTSVETTNTTISDNTIVLNQGETSAGVAASTSGIEIDRGTEANVSILWNESDDSWTLGSYTLKINELFSISNGDITEFTNVIGASGGTISQFTNITGDTGGTISGFTNFTGDTGGTISQFTNITGDTGGTISQFTNITGDTGGTISGFTNFTGDTGGTISQFTNITGDTGGTISGFTNFTGDTGGTISQFTNITGDTGGTISGFTNITGDTGGDISGFTNFTGDGAGTISGFGSLTGNSSGGITQFSSITGTNSGNITGFTNFTGDGTGILSGFTAIVGDTQGYHTGDVKGSLFGDDSTILIDSVNNQFIGTLIGDIVGDMTGDPVLTLATPGDNPGEIINISPGGSENFVNLVAENIRFFGNITRNIEATAGITGDLQGSIFGDDSTLLVDAVNSLIPYSILDGAPTGLSDFTNDLDYAAIVGDAIALNGLPVDTFMTGNLDAQNNDIIDANLVNATGNLNGDIKGSVFADDSSIMIDAVNFTMLSDALTLTPLNAPPAEPVSGMLVAADGTSWDPSGKAGVVSYPVFYDGASWNALY